MDLFFGTLAVNSVSDFFFFFFLLGFYQTFPMPSVSMIFRKKLCFPPLFGALSIVHLLLPSVECRPSDPLRDDDILNTYRVINHHHCQRLCWYRKLCVWYSFYNKNDSPGGSDHNCVLHWDHYGQTGELLEGWTEDMATGDDLVSVNSQQIKTRKRLSGSRY